MRHRMAGRKFGRNTGHRKAMFKNLVTSLFEHERIETTITKAKEICAIAEKVLTLGKNGDLASRRRALAYITKKDIVKKLFSDIAERFKDRNGGYTRITKTRRRLGDGAEMAIIELMIVKKKEDDKKEDQKNEKKEDVAA